MTYKINHVAVGILRQGESIVLIQQEFTTRPPLWLLPGGMVEPGELFQEALVREIAEETGASVEKVGRLAYAMQIDHPDRREQTIAHIFEVENWTGELKSADPDNEILQVALVPLAEAPALLAEIHWIAVREPLLTYLRGECPLGTLWFYRELDGVQVLLNRLPGEASV
ncbi:NUDIX hydrolase [Armatimonas rosea]|uniref:ADP-ribose pyrophosphatase YjhB (NUDIX family) n=1 Tax=Armatimonas rosea TaxID=685828 RepID=A0A7W9STM7_ARMRO|nr:NUDIX hydrolase [Armatimonas rosea]MBB6052088.1 ADP-ribose pyrophosphatase YjhB (NUDIX family) [Armatimonas rosea]